MRKLLATTAILAALGLCSCAPTPTPEQIAAYQADFRTYENTARLCFKMTWVDGRSVFNRDYDRCLRERGYSCARIAAIGARADQYNLTDPIDISRSGDHTHAPCSDD